MGADRYELTTWQSLELVGKHGVGRLCIIEHGYPLAIPVNYRVVADRAAGHAAGSASRPGDDIRFVVRTAPESMLGRYEGLGSIEIDDIDLDNGSAWSVIARGALRRVIGSNDYPDPHPLISEGRNQWLTLTVSGITGRRFTVCRATDDFSIEWQLAPI